MPAVFRKASRTFDRGNGSSGEIVVFVSVEEHEWPCLDRIGIV
jgi:hypothetical protein